MLSSGHALRERGHQVATNTVSTPNLVSVVNQAFFIEPLGGSEHPLNYLDRFPDEVYNKSIDSRLVKLMFALMGPSGIGSLRQNQLQARLETEDAGLETFNLDAFYSNPFQFGRILSETFQIDPSGLLPYVQWAAVRAKDAAYRNRAIQFMNAARGGGTLFGITMAATSGLGHAVEVVENYRALFDNWTDDPLGIDYMGVTRSTEEVIIIPRQETPQSEIQVLTIYGSPTGGTFNLRLPIGPDFNNSGSPSALAASLPYNIARDQLQLALEGLPVVAKGNVVVSGGPFPDLPMQVRFTGALADTNLPALYLDTSNLTGGVSVNATVSITQVGISADGEIAYLSPINQYEMQVAVDRIKPMTTIVTPGTGPGTTQRQAWRSVLAGSSQTQVLRYVTGNNSALWPPVDPIHWIEKGIEHEGPRRQSDIAQHYQNFHNVASITATTEAGTNNEHIGQFANYQVALFPFLGDITVQQQYAQSALAPQTEPLTISAISDSGVPIINDIYPADYQTAPGIQNKTVPHDLFWSSQERAYGDDYLEIDLGSVQAVNYVSFEATQKPYNIALSYDVLDQSPAKRYLDVTVVANHLAPSTTALGFSITALNPWLYVEQHFTNSVGGMIYTRFIQIHFARRNNANSPFAAADGTILPFSLEVRNLRIGRNLS